MRQYSGCGTCSYIYAALTCGQPHSNMCKLALFPTETDGSELPGQRLPDTGRHNHHEGAKNGPHHVCVLPSRPDRPVWIHRLLPIQVCSAWLGRVAADGGEVGLLRLNTLLHTFLLSHQANTLLCKSKSHTNVL